MELDFEALTPCPQRDGSPAHPEMKGTDEDREY
jgi:hypothetical protein